ncbi:hypothetical protein ASE01_03340 [Nocardioides sp. Root190]|nr:hypothetical protein ASE01_03340 [Nocardioides sp. Root190]
MGTQVVDDLILTSLLVDRSGIVIPPGHADSPSHGAGASERPLFLFVRISVMSSAASPALTWRMCIGPASEQAKFHQIAIMGRSVFN